MAFALRMLQQNVSTCAKVTEEITDLSISEDVDILFIHEPVHVDGRIDGFDPPIEAVVGTEDDEIPLAAIVFFNTNLEAWKVPQLSNDRCVSVRIMGDLGEIFLVCLYCPLSETMESCLETLQTILTALNEKSIIVCIDANAKSMWWSNSDKTDSRGEKLEDFIISNMLCVLNRKDPLGTSSYGTNHTDLTLVTNNIVDRVTEWQAMHDWTSGDKRTIGMEINLRSIVPVSKSPATASTSCQEVEEEKEEETSFIETDSSQQQPTDEQDTRTESNVIVSEQPTLEELGLVDSDASDCENVICPTQDEQTVEASFNQVLASLDEEDSDMWEGTSSVESRCIVWWNDKLDQLRLKIRHAKRMMQYNLRKDAKLMCRIRYYKLKRSYVREMRKARIAYCRDIRRRFNGSSPVWSVQEGSEHDSESLITSTEGSTTKWDEAIPMEEDDECWLLISELTTDYPQDSIADDPSVLVEGFPGSGDPTSGLPREQIAEKCVPSGFEDDNYVSISGRSPGNIDDVDENGATHDDKAAPIIELVDDERIHECSIEVDNPVDVPVGELSKDVDVPVTGHLDTMTDE